MKGMSKVVLSIKNLKGTALGYCIPVLYFNDKEYLYY